MPKTNQQGTQQETPPEGEDQEMKKGAQQGAGEGAVAGGTPADFDTFMKTQPEEIQKLYGDHTAGLKKALSSEREQGKNYQKRLEGITKLLGSDPEKAKQEMDKLAEENKASQARIEFLEDAMKPEIECLNPAAAWLVAQGKGLFRSNGTPDWKSIREEAPELFGKRTVRTHGGDGTGEEAPKKWNINDAMREKMKEARGG